MSDYDSPMCVEFRQRITDLVEQLEATERKLAASTTDIDRLMQVLRETEDRLAEAEAACDEEKQRRAYYQDITYAVCNLFDQVLGHAVVNGTKDTPSTCVQDATREVLEHLAAAKAERDRITDGVRYWCYCMSEGMRSLCPEKVEELMDFLISLKIAPYYMPGEEWERLT